MSSFQLVVQWKFVTCYARINQRTSPNEIGGGQSPATWKLNSRTGDPPSTQTETNPRRWFTLANWCYASRMKSTPPDQSCNLNIAPDILAGSPVYLAARGTNIRRCKSTHDPAINPRAFLRASFSKRNSFISSRTRAAGTISPVMGFSSIRCLLIVFHLLSPVIFRFPLLSRYSFAQVIIGIIRLLEIEFSFWRIGRCREQSVCFILKNYTRAHIHANFNRPSCNVDLIFF